MEENTFNGKLTHHKDGDKVMITDQAIQKVKKVAITGIDETDSFIQLAHKELLKYSTEENDSNEVATVVNLKTNEKTDFIKGDQHSVNLESGAVAYHMLRTSDFRSLAILHNHPGKSYFSLNDINFFFSYDSIKTMIIVTNSGEVWYISKGKNTTIDQYAELMKNLEGKYKGKKLVKKFLKNAYNLGIGRN